MIIKKNNFSIIFSNNFEKNDYEFNDEYSLGQKFYQPFENLIASEDSVNNYSERNLNIEIKNNKISQKENFQDSTRFISNNQKTSLIYFPNFENYTQNVNELNFKNFENKNNNYEFNQKEKNSSNFSLNKKIKNKNINKTLGRKRKNSNEISVHNKFKDDNLMKRCVNILKENFREYINSEIENTLIIMI